MPANLPFTLFHVDDERGLRGGERQVLYLAGAMRARGHRNVMAGRAGSAFLAEASRLGLETLALPFWSELDLWTALRLGLAARREPRALLHAHTGHGVGIASLASICGVRFVAHRRVDFPLSGALSLDLKYARAGRVVCISRAVAEVMRQAGLDSGRMTVVPSAVPVTPEEAGWAGLPPGHFAPPTAQEKAALRGALAGRYGLDHGKTWVGNLAALVPHKDHATLVAAAALVLAKRPETLFLVAGKGEQEAAIKEDIRARRLEGKVVLLGQVEEPVKLMKALDLFVLSSWGEGLGSVMIEAAACGLPIVATRAGGIPEFVLHERTGLLVEPRDPAALAAALLRLIEDQTLASRLRIAALERLPEFGLTRLAERMEAVYAELA